MKKHLLFLLLGVSVALTSCRSGEAGEPGPAGSDNLNKQGSVSGTFYHSYYNDYTMENDTVIIPFNFEYYESEQDNLYSYDVSTTNQSYVTHSYNFMRRSLKDREDFINIDYSYGVITGPIPSDFTIELGLSRTLSNNGVFGFNSYSYFDNSIDYSTLTISNYSFNYNTGALSFDFVMTIDPYSIHMGNNYSSSYWPKVVGRVDVILKKKLGSSPV